MKDIIYTKGKKFWIFIWLIDIKENISIEVQNVYEVQPNDWQLSTQVKS